MTRSVVRTNRRIAPLDALRLAVHAIRIANGVHLNPEFFCATLLQESGFDPNAHSAASAIGIGQFTLETADMYGVDPFDWREGMRGAARLLRSYVRAYEGVYDDPYAMALAAYNAGPGAVAKYRGVPPYPETREYIADVYDRWGRIARDQHVAERRLIRGMVARWLLP